jgi:drug/metabolite transporter (DMT)-like permease
MSALHAPRARLVTALGALYLLWGSTYLAIRIAVATMPPLLMGGSRNLAAGLLLFAGARVAGAPAPERRHWLPATLVGALLFVGGNGAVVWSEQHVPSGLVALIVSSVPLWVTVIESLRPGGRRPRPLTWLGVAVGLGGIALLVGPGQLRGGHGIDPLSTLVLVGGSLSWASGSILSRNVDTPRSPLITTALQMIGGGTCMILVGLAFGEGRRLDVPAITRAAWLAWVYLIMFGSIVAFTAYAWLLRNTTPALATTYAYVNPVIALVLGWGLGGEPLSPRVGLAAAVIVGAVALITLSRGRGAPAAPPAPRKA